MEDLYWIKLFLYKDLDFSVLETATVKKRSGGEFRMDHVLNPISFPS